MNSWIKYSTDSDFSIYNIPFGIYNIDNNKKKAASIIGNFVIDLAGITPFLKNVPEKIKAEIFLHDYLNDFISLGKETTSGYRICIQQFFSDNSNSSFLNELLAKNILIPIENVKLHLPVKIGNYTDFYSSMDHAKNVGTMFRDPDNALLPNWKHLPVGYHGRASSITISGTPFHRPKGQTKPADSENPIFGPCKLLDFELETAFVIGKNSALGQSISTKEAPEYIFGMLLFNDWSARDIQTWEYVPLGPFLSKNFNSTVSPWIVTMEALEPFKIKGPEQNPVVLDYLKYENDFHYDIHLNVAITPENGEESIICKSNFKYMYWNMLQQLAHHTINGCNVCIGDLYASGTISGPENYSFGSMLELTWRGTKPIKLKDGSERKFINDNDTVTIYGYSSNGNIRVGFGKSESKSLPAIQ